MNQRSAVGSKGCGSLSLTTDRSQLGIGRGCEGDGERLWDQA